MPAKTSKFKLSAAPGTNDIRTAMDVPGWTQAIMDHLEYRLARTQQVDGLHLQTVVTDDRAG